MGTTYTVLESGPLVIELDEMSSKFQLAVVETRTLYPGSKHEIVVDFESRTRLTPENLWELAFKIAKVASYWDLDGVSTFRARVREELVG